VAVAQSKKQSAEALRAGWDAQTSAKKEQKKSGPTTRAAGQVRRAQVMTRVISRETRRAADAAPSEARIVHRWTTRKISGVV